MEEKCISENAVDADIASARFQVGVVRKQWRIIKYEFPILIMAVAANETDGIASEYYFHMELKGFRATPPEVRIWNMETNSLLQEDRRPKGSTRVVEAFKNWGSNTVYRPWERHGVTHNHWERDHPSLAWHPKRDLTFILEDLYGLLTSNAARRLYKET